MKNFFSWGAGHFALCLLLIFFALNTLIGCKKQKESENAVALNIQEAREDFFAMDTKMTIKVYGENAAEAAKMAKARLLSLDALLSPTKKGSDVERLNRRAGEDVAIALETMRVLELAEKTGEETAGALDITIAPLLRLWGFLGGAHHLPTKEEIEAAQNFTGKDKLTLDKVAGTARLADNSSIELGAVAKGFAGEIAASELKAYGVRSAILDLGGNIEVIGKKINGEPWRIGIRNPFGEPLIGTLSLTDSAVVTSAIDQRFFQDRAGNRYWHILDPATGAPAASGIASVSIVSAAGGRADALSTALFVMGKERGVKFWRKQRDFEMLLVDMAGHVSITKGLFAHFTAGEGVVGEVEVIQ